MATRADLPTIVAIYNQAVEERASGDTEPVTVEQRADWFDAHPPDRRPILLACSGERVVGWASLSDHRPGRKALRHTAEVSYYVAREDRGRGVGSSLLRACIERCPALSIRTVFAILLDDNVGSIRLLEKFGFERWGHLPRVADYDGVELGQLIYGLRVSARDSAGKRRAPPASESGGAGRRN